MPPSHLKFQSWIQDGGLQNGGRGTYVIHFVQLYPQTLYTASQVRTTSRSWDKEVLTDLCLTLYFKDDDDGNNKDDHDDDDDNNNNNNKTQTTKITKPKP
jgi:hypothetical protein